MVLLAEELAPVEPRLASTEDFDEAAGVEYLGAGLEDVVGLSINDVSVVLYWDSAFFPWVV